MTTTETTEIEAQQPSTLLALTSSQSWWTDRQLKALHHMGVAEDTPPGDLAVFLHHAQRTGLDPFAKQIYLIGRNVKENDHWTTKYTIQTGIDGYRVIGDRVAERRGDVIEHDDTLWAGKDGIWHDLWVSDEPPSAAKYTLMKNGKRNVATVMYREFVQTKRGGEPNSMWSRMPANQLAKCAEVAAWRKVYPNDFADLVLEGSALPTDDAPSPQERPASRLVTAEDILARNVSNEAPDNPLDDSTRLNRRMHALFGKADCTDRDDRLIVTQHIIAVLEGKARDDITSSNDLTPAETQALVDQLSAWERRGELGGAVTDILNTAALREAEAAEQDET
jgi:phage recombination protein Bet